MKNSKNFNTTIIKTDKVIFFSSLIFLIVFTFPLLIWPEESQSVLNTLKILIENNVGGIYQLLAIVVLVFVIWLAISRFGNIVLGNNDYNFSTFSWASMLFCAGVATGILYWGSIEWAYYMDKPPLNAIA